jgi:hypothetical protein
MLADGLYERFGRPDFVLSEQDAKRRACWLCGIEELDLLR